jgi:hypothetical protein
MIGKNNVTLNEGVRDVADLVERAAKGWAAINMAPEYTKHFGGLDDWQLNNLLWQTARMVHEVIEMAGKRGHDIQQGLTSLEEALAGTLYAEEEKADPAGSTQKDRGFRDPLPGEQGEFITVVRASE